MPVFNNPEKIAEAWYWLVPSKRLPRGAVRRATIGARELVVYRTRTGRPVALDAYCAHMGSDLGQARVEGESLRCFFHRWKWGASGNCEEIPCQASVPASARLGAYPVVEKHGLVWAWIGESAPGPFPEVPELAGKEVASAWGNPFRKACHPSVVLCNAIDAQHFQSVHGLEVDLDLDPVEADERRVIFRNRTPFPRDRLWRRLAARFYAGPLTYELCYWYGTSGTVTLGPDFFHFHILFALRPTRDGRTEGWTIPLTKRRRGLGQLVSWFALATARLVGAYFAVGDTRIFETIRFRLGTPIAADKAILAFVRHVDSLRALPRGGAV